MVQWITDQYHNLSDDLAKMCVELCLVTSHRPLKLDETDEGGCVRGERFSVTTAASRVLPVNNGGCESLNVPCIEAH